MQQLQLQLLPKEEVRVLKKSHYQAHSFHLLAMKSFTSLGRSLCNPNFDYNCIY